MRKQSFLPALLVVLNCSLPTLASELKDKVEAYVHNNQKEIVAELLDVLAIPNDAADQENIRRKAERLRVVLEHRGLQSELLETEGNPLVYGELKVPEATRTLLLYCHYDGIPVDRPKWSQADPYQPVLRNGKLEDGASELDPASVTSFEADWRLYARSASDDISPIVALVTALDALRAADIQPSSNLRIILDGEEEAGSPSFGGAIERYRDMLQADLMLIFDGPEHPSSRPTLVFGARGNLGLELTVYGAKAPLHSGHYGNWAPNPAAQLARLLATMKDEDGRTTIEGYYDGIEISPEVRGVLDGVPDDHEALMKLYGFARPDGVGDSLQEAIQYPSFNIRGLESGWVGAEARTAIPDRATASIDIRPVPETPNDDLFGKVVAHIRRQGYHIVHEEPDDATRARHARIVKVVRTTDLAPYRTPLGDPQAQTLVQALTRVWGEPPVRIRNFGSALPIAPLIQALGYPAVSVCTVNFDNNQHAPNENIRLGHFFRMIVTAATVLTM